MDQTSFEKGLHIIKQHVKTLGNHPGVYRMLSEDGEVLYVGKAKNLKKRATSYTQPQKLIHRIQRMVSLTRDMDFTITASEAEALLLEASFIKRYKPRFNILLKDDKSFPYLMITKHPEAPQLVKHRGALDKTKGIYFGPFASSTAVNETLTFLTKIFELRTCRDAVYASRTRPCLQYHIKRCTAPCVNYVSPDAYKKQVDEAVKFLEGKTTEIQKNISEEMYKLSAAQQYEKAAVLRDRIKALNTVQLQQQVGVAHETHTDLFAIYQEGGLSCVAVFFFRHGCHYGHKAYFPKHDKEETPRDILRFFIPQFYQARETPLRILVNEELDDMALLKEALVSHGGHALQILRPKRGQALKLVDMATCNAKEALLRKTNETLSQQHFLKKLEETFRVSAAITRIEIYDNSHLFGTNPYGAMVVAGEEGFEKNAYRKFSMKGRAGEQGDDYGMMREMLHRRFEKTVPETIPQLMIIDGGRGQLNAALEVVRACGLNVKIIGMGKGPHRNAGEEYIYEEGKEPYQLPKNDPVLFFLQRLRDEAHRFAIGSHRLRRAKSAHTSSLDAIPGIGTKRRQALLTHFGSMKGIKEAALKELAATQGISDAIAKKIYDYFHES